jgi:hypothetical protein
MEELRRGTARPRFGSLEEIRGSEFVAQVTNAGEGVWVVVLLYKDGIQVHGHVGVGGGGGGGRGREGGTATLLVLSDELRVLCCGVLC